MNARTHITTAAIALAGAGMWYAAGSSLENGGHFESQPNPLGIKRSPYGQVLAMAIQTPIDGDWHGGLEIHDHAHGEGCESCDHHAEPVVADAHDHDGDCDHDHDHGVCEHDHGDSEACGHGCEDHDAASGESLLDHLTLAVSQRTNPNPPTAGHQFYLRREIEKKLRFAYELDPSHFANYNSYHLFLTQRQLGTRHVSVESTREAAFDLADHTIRYCLRESSDPRPALTAASAAYNVLEQMLLADEDVYSLEEMAEQLGVVDFCIKRHIELLEASVRSGQLELLSPQRQAELLDRSTFTRKLRESAATAIHQRVSDQQSTASHHGS